MRVLRTISTPWAPYSVMFSRDGTRLAIGGGSWYGDGGIQLVDLSSGKEELLRCADLPGSSGQHHGPPTVSGVCFSPDDRHLAASTWSSSHRGGPTLLFEIRGLRLTHRATLRHDWRGNWDICPTGVLLHDCFVISRNNSSYASHTLDISYTPPDLAVGTGRALHHLTSSQIAVVRESVITGNGDDLFAVPLRRGLFAPQPLSVRGELSVTAICAPQVGNAVVTGGRDGRLEAWSWEGRWQRQMLRPATNYPRPDWPDLDITWATYTPNSIAGISSLAFGDRWASVSAGGEVCLWAGETFVRSWQLPEPGSPRSLAAHPDRPWLAVGIKKGGFGRPQSAVVIAETDPVVIDPDWHTPDALSLAQATDVERQSRDSPLDPARLSILADALEEAGCADADLLAHLRDHGPYLRECWVVERLLGRK